MTTTTSKTTRIGRAVKRFKERMRRALFGFFKDEILAATAAQAAMCTKHVERPLNLDGMKLKNLEVRFQLDALSPATHNTINANHEYERALRQARERLFEMVMEYAVVDAQSVVALNHMGRERVFRIGVYVGVPKGKA